MRRWWSAVLAGVALAGCTGGALAAAEQPVGSDWRRLATKADRTRLRQWRQAWVEALESVRASGGTAALARDPLLFDPDRGLTHAAPPVGTYRCRMTKLAPRDAGMEPIATGAWARCTVTNEGASVRFAAAGVQRAQGNLFVDTDARSVFLGTLALGDESRAMRYGRDARRDMAGIVERIGERRWRMVLPYPAFATTLDLIEIAGS